jgi:hypothetical protein
MPDAAVNMCLFYMFSLLAESEKGRGTGAVILYQIDTSSPRQRISIKYLERLVCSLPLRLSAVHILSSSPVLASIESEMSSFCHEVFVHDNGPLENMASALEDFGFVKTSLPKSIDGEWGLSMFIQWQELRTRIEFQLPLGNSAKNSSSLAAFPGLKDYRELSPSDENTERDRRLNVIHCRRKRDHTRIHVDLLEEECVDLTLQRKRLLDENARLADLVERAKNQANASLSQSSMLATLPGQQQHEHAPVDEPATQTVTRIQEENNVLVLDALSGLLGLSSSARQPSSEGT